MSKKKFGQNFLIDDSIARNIVENIKINNRNIIEIGPGNLAITKYILEKKPKNFVAIEIDKEIVDKYKEKKNISQFLINEDALKFNELSFFKNEKFSIISNLPFNASSKLLIKWLNLHSQKNCIVEMLLMFQKELADRIVSKENSKKYGRISILAQSQFNISNKILVKKENFLPVPKVDAQVLKFENLKNKILHKKSFDKLEKLTSFFFNSRRKKNKKKIEKIFNQKKINELNLDIFYEKRAENIPKEIFYQIANVI